jgi:hypothetical protein
VRRYRVARRLQALFVLPTFFATSRAEDDSCQALMNSAGEAWE